MRELDPAGFGKRVAIRRKKRRISQEELAAVSGLSQSNIGYIEQGKISRSSAILGHAALLAIPLKTTREWLLWGEGPEEAGLFFLPTRSFADHYEALPDEHKAAMSEQLAKLEKTGGKRRARN